jgi:hypothetical protein
MSEHDRTRELWLQNACELLRSDFEAISYPLPASVRVSIGFPSKSALARQKQRIGECWDASATIDNTAQIFITPLLDDSVRILDVLVHELVHAAVGAKCKHRGAFVKAATAIGLTGKMTATVAGPKLVDRLNDIIERLGPIPHARLIAGTKDKTQTTRLLKAECSNDEYIVRLSKKTAMMGLPICPICNRSMPVDGLPDDTETED